MPRGQKPLCLIHFSVPSPPYPLTHSYASHHSCDDGDSDLRAESEILSGVGDKIQWRAIIGSPDPSPPTDHGSAKGQIGGRGGRGGHCSGANKVSRAGTAVPLALIQKCCSRIGRAIVLQIGWLGLQSLKNKDYLVTISSATKGVIEHHNVFLLFICKSLSWMIARLGYV